MQYDIIATGSSGNAVVIENSILIDCGVPYKALKEHIQNLKIVLLTHIHGDHFNKSTLRRLSNERPTLRFGCCRWLIQPLLDCGVDLNRIDVYEIGRLYRYSGFSLCPVRLYHNVPNAGYRLFYGNEKLLYATDTNTMQGISAKGYDLYMIEANFEEDEILERIQLKRASGQYAYETEVLHNHLSKQHCDNFIYSNMGDNSRYIYMHEHCRGEEDGTNTGLYQ